MNNFLKLKLALLFICSFTIVNAKKVKFAVDMTGQEISPNGVHVSGDFQTAAGFPGGNSNSATTLLTPETADTNIYSIVVDIPAHQKYEYRFINGDLFYETEFVPEYSRVGYEFNDNRWIYVDSIANDTTFIGAVLFGGNAPAGKKLLKVVVDVQNINTIPSTVYAAGSIANFNGAYSKLFSFGGTVYENYCFVDAGISNYKFYGGATQNDAETVPSNCASNGLRQANVLTDTIIQTVCFASCNACSFTAVNNNANTSNITIAPNPTKDFATINFADAATQHSIYLYDARGKLIKLEEVFEANNYTLNCKNLVSGIYEIVVLSNTGKVFKSKLGIE